MSARQLVMVCVRGTAASSWPGEQPTACTGNGRSRYEFRVDGRLPEDSREAFCGMLVEEIPPGVVLRGAVIDEPHLLGIIEQLGVLGLSLVFVRPMARPGRAAKRTAGTSPPTGGKRRAARRLARRTGNRRADHDD